MKTFLLRIRFFFSNLFRRRFTIPVVQVGEPTPLDFAKLAATVTAPLAKVTLESEAHLDTLQSHLLDSARQRSSRPARRARGASKVVPSFANLHTET